MSKIIVNDPLPSQDMTSDIHYISDIVAAGLLTSPMDTLSGCRRSLTQTFRLEALSALFYRRFAGWWSVYFSRVSPGQVDVGGQLASNISLSFGAVTAPELLFIVPSFCRGALSRAAAVWVAKAECRAGEAIL